MLKIIFSFFVTVSHAGWSLWAAIGYRAVIVCIVCVYREKEDEANKHEKYDNERNRQSEHIYVRHENGERAEWKKAEAGKKLLANKNHRSRIISIYARMRHSTMLSLAAWHPVRNPLFYMFGSNCTYNRREAQEEKNIEERIVYKNTNATKEWMRAKKKRSAQKLSFAQVKWIGCGTIFFRALCALLLAPRQYTTDY